MAAWNGSLVPSESLWQSHVSVNLKLIHVHRTQIFRTDALTCTGLSLFLPRDGYCSKSVEIPSKKTSEHDVENGQKIRLTVTISIFSLSKGTFGHVSKWFVAFPSVEIQICLVEKYSAPCWLQLYANHVGKTKLLIECREIPECRTL